MNQTVILCDYLVLSLYLVKKMLISWLQNNMYHTVYLSISSWNYLYPLGENIVFCKTLLLLLLLLFK